MFLLAFQCAHAISRVQEIAYFILIAQKLVGLRAFFRIHVRPPTSVFFHLRRASARFSNHGVAQLP